jgi:hypothetical protein
MKPHDAESRERGALTRRAIFSPSGSLLFLTAGLHAASVAIGDPPVQDLEGWKKLYTGTEWLFITRVIMPACGAPGKEGEESNFAYCQWLIGQQPPGDNSRLRLVYDFTTFSDRYPKDTSVGVINATRIVDPHGHRFESYSAFARVRSHTPEPRVFLTAAVEERTKTDSGDGAVIRHVSKEFSFTDHTWTPIESRVYRIL